MTVQTSEQLSASVEAFLARGGRIQEVPGFAPVPPPARREPSPVAATPQRRRRDKVEAERRPCGTPRLAESLERIRDLAKTHTAIEAARVTGFARTTLQRLADRNGFAFQPSPRERVKAPEVIARVRELAGLHNCTEVARITGINRRALTNMAQDVGFDFVDGSHVGGDNLRRQAHSPEVRARRAERLKVLAAAGASKRNAASRIGMCRRTLDSICAEFGIVFGGAA
ncbi:hypothetical protein D9M70_396580 [compost metagenome]